jgi:hypothetical protein
MDAVGVALGKAVGTNEAAVSSDEVTVPSLLLASSEIGLEEMTGTSPGFTSFDIL